jgi:hypothetical protein
MSTNGAAPVNPTANQPSSSWATDATQTRVQSGPDPAIGSSDSRPSSKILGWSISAIVLGLIVFLSNVAVITSIAFLSSHASHLSEAMRAQMHPMILVIAVANLVTSVGFVAGGIGASMGTGWGRKTLGGAAMVAVGILIVDLVLAICTRSNIAAHMQMGRHSPFAHGFIMGAMIGAVLGDFAKMAYCAAIVSIMRPMRSASRSA